MSIGRLHVITDTRPGRDATFVVKAALAAGAPTVQVRAPELDDRALYELSSQVLDLCAAHAATCIVDDRVDVALAVGAHGVHLGERDLPVAVARRVASLSRDDLIVGATARHPSGARDRERDGAHYLGVGPVYRSGSKVELPTPLGPPGVAAVAGAVGIPVIAIAGVTADRVPELLDAGAHGVAVISAVSEAEDPFAATEQLLRVLDKG